MDNEIKKALEDVVQSPETIAKNLTVQKMAPYLGSAGAVLGTMVAPGLGTAAGAGLGQIGARMADLAYGNAQPSDAQNPAKEALMPMAQTALGGIDIPGAGKGASAIIDAADEIGEPAAVYVLKQKLPGFFTKVTMRQKH